MKRELRAELNPEIEKLAAKRAENLAAEELRGAREQLRDEQRQNRSLRTKLTKLQRSPAGRAQELGVQRQQTLAEILQARFRTDRISVTRRGVAGADVVQVVCDGAGAACGSILWETKRAANWQKAWLRKLRTDQRAGKHEMGVIVSDTLPDQDRTLMQIDGVWVTTIDAGTRSSR
jgi:hypothetical protein